MNQYHDPVRYENYLRQCLAHDKKPLGIFLGAGAPMAIRITSGKETIPLIPDISEMTKQICTAISGCSLCTPFETMKSHFDIDGKPFTNIEEILSHIRSLGQVAGNGEVRGLTSSNLADLDAEICGKINDIVNKSLSSSDTPYHKVATWIGAISRIHPVEIFTTNYDLLMEQALEESLIPYFDGFTGSRLTFFDSYSIEDDQLPVRWARLWKLHGSINWRCVNKSTVYRSMTSLGKDESRVIHPSHLKYEESRKMPYLALIDRLKAFIKKPSSLLITCGYSFRDQHLNDMIIQGLKGNPMASCFALLYGELDNYPESFSLASITPNLSLLAKNEAVIGTKRLPWVTKSKEDVDIDSLATTWASIGSGDVVEAHFNLGDFGSLGAFFEEIVGEEQKGSE